MQTVHTLVARDGNVSASVQYRVVAPAPVNVLDHIDLVQILPGGDTQAVGGVIYAARGSQLTLRAIGHATSGEAMAFAEQWSLSTSLLGQLYRGANGTMVLALGTHYRGTVVLVVRDRATGVAAQVQVVVN